MPVVPGLYVYMMGFVKDTCESDAELFVKTGKEEYPVQRICSS